MGGWFGFNVEQVGAQLFDFVDALHVVQFTPAGAVNHADLIDI